MTSLYVLNIVLRARTIQGARLRLGRISIWVLAAQLIMMSGLFLSASVAQDNAKKQASSRAKVDLSPWQQVIRWEGTVWAKRVHYIANQAEIIDRRTMVSGHVVLDEVKPGDSEHGLTHLGWRGKVYASPSVQDYEEWTGTQVATIRGAGDHVSDAALDMAANGVYVISMGGIKIPVTRVIKSVITGTTVEKQVRWCGITDPPEKANMVSMIQPKPGQKFEPSEFKSALRGRLPAKGLVIQGSFAVRGHDEYADEKRNGTLEVEWVLWPSGELEAVVEIPGYDSWLPEGNLKDWEAPGNTLKIKATLQGKGGKPLGNKKARSFVFNLVRVSDEPGICLNFPHDYFTPESGWHADLRFDPRGQSPGAEMIELEGKALKVPAKGGTTAEAILSCYDFGAYGLLRVTAQLEGGGEVFAYLKGKPTQHQIRIPYSVGNSVIAESWRKARHIGSMPDSADEDIIGGADRPGDGLSVYEEYRGFSVRDEHKRTRPKAKTVFVHGSITNIDGGLRLLERVSGLETFHIHASEMQDTKRRVVNFNHRTDHIVDQHGLWIVLAELENALGRSTYGPPKFVDFVMLDRASYGSVKSDRNKSLNDTIAHELCHALCVPHHGAGVEYRFLRRLNDAGQWYTSEAKFWVTRPHSEHSGVESCIMRYNAADFIERTPGNDNLLEYYGGHEPPGTLLCIQAEGTGVNAPPRSKCGDAVNGSCYRRITVSDVYPQFAPQYKVK